MRIGGYKAFNYDMTNRYGQVFEEGKIYSMDVSPKFGVHGNGFHFCKRMEDTLRYVPGMEEEIRIAKVTGLGEMVQREDTYYEYFDMYCTNKIRIDRILSRQEILKMALKMAPSEAIRFIRGFRLTEEEILLFQLQFEGDYNVLRNLSYYQEGMKDAFYHDPLITYKK